jgi:hypothetical protein
MAIVSPCPVGIGGHLVTAGDKLIEASAQNHLFFSVNKMQEQSHDWRNSGEAGHEKQRVPIQGNGANLLI